MIQIHPAVVLFIEIWGLLIAISFVIFLVVKMEAKLKSAKDVIESAKDLPGGLNYGPNKEDANEYELEEAWWKTHA